MPRKKQYQWKSSDEAEGFDLPPSRSEKKRQSLALQNMGEELTRLGPQEVKNLDLPADLREALQLYARIGDHEGRRRQMQFIGKLMRKLDDEVIANIRAALQQQKDGSASELAVLHLAEQWREQMLQDTSHEQALTNWLQQHPATDAQHLRALVRQARKDAQKAAKEPVSDASDTAPRHGKAYRDLFQLIKQALLQGGAGNADDAQAQAEQEQDGMSDSGND